MAEIKTDVFPALLRHPDIAPGIDWGLGGNTFIDHIISLVEQAKEKRPRDRILADAYQGLQLAYPLYFPRDTAGPIELKNSAYKACNGF